MQKFPLTVMVATPWYQKDQQWVRKVNTLASYSPLSFFLFLTNKKNYLQKLIKVKSKKDPVEKNKQKRFEEKESTVETVLVGDQISVCELKLNCFTKHQIYTDKNPTEVGTGSRAVHVPSSPIIITNKEKRLRSLTIFYNM